MDWKIEDTELVYGINKLDLNFLDITSEGEIAVNLDHNRITINEIVHLVRKHNILDAFQSLRVILPQLIENNLQNVYNQFKCSKTGGKYQLSIFYPLKANHSKYVFDLMFHSNPRFEVGTANELKMVYDSNPINKPVQLQIMCNGVKTVEYIELINQGLNKHQIYVSVESLEELHQLMTMKYFSEVKIFLRIKPYIEGTGIWKKSVGPSSKFGLNIDELLQIIRLIQSEQLQHQLVGIHAHPGSQIKDLKYYRRFLHYLVEIFIQLNQKGLNLTIINIGGGLPVNYHSRPDFPQNIDFIDCIVDELRVISGDLTSIFMEIGRNLVANSGIVIVKPQYSKIQTVSENLPVERKFETMISQWDTINSDEQDHLDLSIDSIKQKQQHRKLLKQGIRQHIKKLLEKNKINEITSFLTSTDKNKIYETENIIMGQFSIFNEVGDYVKVQQYFPVIPSRYLDKQPDTIAQLVDLTCDSLGEISRYSLKENKKWLFTKDAIPIAGPHSFEITGFPITNHHDQYYLIPLVGAYKETSTFDHNLIRHLPEILLFYDNGWQVKLSQQLYKNN